MPVVVGGTNHKTSPLWFREKAALSSVSLFDTRKRLFSRPEIREVAVVSTCHRVEFYVAGPDPEAALSGLREFLLHEFKLSEPDLDQYFYFEEGASCVSHFFTVVTGADSMVVGEAQIAGQIQTAFKLAQKEGTLGPELDKLSTAANELVKRVRDETGFSSTPVSIGSVATELARLQLGSLKNRSAMILGAGEMGILTARALSSNGIATILVANRTLSRAQDVAHSLGGRAVDYSELAAQIEKVDILVTSTSAPHVLVKKAMIERVIEARPARPLFIIDLAVPRNVDPASADLPGVVLINVDGLQEVAEQNSRERLLELDKVLAIIHDETEKFAQAQSKHGMSLMDLALG